MVDDPSEHTRSGDRIAVVIVSYGTSRLVLTGLPALLKELDGFGAHHVFVVDNLSPDGDGARLEAGLAAFGAQDRVTFLASPINGGFAAGNNLAFAEIRRLDWTPTAVLLLNPDAELRPGAIREMLAVMHAQPAAGFVGPRLENPDGTSWVGAFNFPTFATEVSSALGIDLIARRHPTVIPDTDAPTRADWVTGTATLIRWEALVALGDMDDGYFLYYEEVDYMLQGHRLGWESWHAPAALVLHEAGAATGIKNGAVKAGRMPGYWFLSWTRYFAKNHGPAYARATAVLKICAMLLGDLQRRLRGKSTPRPEAFLRDFTLKAAAARLSPLPSSDRAKTPGGQPRIR
jgi:GT2 family glycosyltransferase